MLMFVFPDTMHHSNQVVFQPSESHSTHFSKARVVQVGACCLDEQYVSSPHMVQGTHGTSEGVTDQGLCPLFQLFGLLQHYR